MMKKQFFYTMSVCMIQIAFITSCTNSSDKVTLGKAKTEILVESSNSWNGDYIPPYRTGTPKLTISKITVPPKTRMSWHYHPMNEGAIILKGELIVEDDQGKEIHLKEGDALIEMVNRIHFGRNETDKETIIYSFYAGVKELENSIEKEP